MTAVLKHLRVLDLSRILAGPWAGQLLADLGADVIKVERPGRGDDTRGWGPPYAEHEQAREAAYYLSCNRGKRSVAVDITTPEGQDLVRELAVHSDVLLENYKVGGLARYGLDYPSLKVMNPGLVYCSITGFGQTGPYRDRAGYDFLLQGMGGLMSITGQADADGGEPVKVGVAITDVLTGMYAAVSVLAALAERQRTGHGRHVDLALLDVQVASLANQAMNYLVSGHPPERMGNAHPNIVPYQVFATADGHVVLTVGNDDQFRRFCQAAERPELAEHPDYATNAGRVRCRDQLVPLLEGVFRQHPSAHWLETLEVVGVPCGPVNKLDQVFADPQVQARQLQRALKHPSLGSIPSVANPIRYDGESATAERAPPELGADTEQVLRDVLGRETETIAELRRRGIIG
ncbi:MAG: CoA transferase [Ectothiorhodospiraceae bacterium]|nr:CoA transferase [Ectothiorhodospiraceae bacterium]